MFDSLQYDSTKCDQQYELNSYATMATHSDLPHDKKLFWPPLAFHFDIC